MSDSILGIDIAKLKFDVSLLRNGKYKSKIFKNDDRGFEDLLKWLKECQADFVHICLEATGVYGDALSRYLVKKGFKVSVVNPAQIKRFAQSELSRTKTDKADSRLIARFCQAMKPPVWQPLPPHIDLLQGWVKRLESLQSMHQEESNRLDVSPEAIQPGIKEVCEMLAKKIDEVKKHIHDHIDQHSDLKHQKALLETIPGVGGTTIARILSFMGTPVRFKNAKQLAAFVGLNPKQHESGSSVRGRSRLSKTGDSNLRKALYMPAISAKQHNPIIKVFCARLKESGKPPMVIIGAAMRKLLHIIYGVLKSGKPFNPALAKA